MLHNMTISGLQAIHPHDKKELFPSFFPSIFLPSLFPFSLSLYLFSLLAFLVAQSVQNSAATDKTQDQSMGQEDPLDKEMATHSRILAWDRGA